MATIKFSLQSKKSSSPVFLRLSLGKNQYFKRRTNFLANPKEWNLKDGLPKSNSEINKITRRNLIDLRETIYERLAEATNDGKNISSEWLKKEIAIYHGDATSEEIPNTLCGYIDYIVKFAHIRPNSKGGVGIGKSRIQQYKRLSVLFEEFYGSRACKISEIDSEMFNKYRNWFVVEKEFDKNSTYVSKKLNDLKGVCKEANINHNIRIADNLFSVRIPAGKTYDEDMDVITLSEKEIELIEKLELTDDKLINARKWLIINCFMGQRGNSLVNRVKKESFSKTNRGYVVKLSQSKGNKAVTIPVLPKIEKIYLQDELPYKVNTNTLNKQFQKLGELAGIDEMIMGRKQDNTGRKGVKKLRPKYKYMTTHTGRRSFISNHIAKGIHRESIMKVTGHTKEETLLKYMNQSSDFHIDTFMDAYDNSEE